jgi:hypothetical protein
MGTERAFTSPRHPLTTWTDFHSSIVLCVSYLALTVQIGPKKCTHSLIVNIFGTKQHVVTILARYCSVMFAHVRDFTYNKIVLRLTTIDMSGHTWISTWTKDRSKRSYWVPTTVSWLHTSRLVPMGNLEGWSLSTKASHTRNHRSLTCSHDTRHTDSRSLAGIDAVQPLMVVTRSLSAQEL